MPSGTNILTRVTTATDVAAAGRQARQLAEDLGFGETEAAQIELAARELAANVVTHGGGGQVRCYADEAGGQQGISLEALDGGPGVADPEEALTDGYTTVEGSLGCGLGTVNRLMDRLELGRAEDGRGLRAWAHRQLDTGGGPTVRCFDVGVATRPHPGLRVNGDAFVVERSGGRLLAAVIDGLGHGAFAHRAAQKAREYVVDHWEVPFDDLFRGVGRNCRGTRGAVMTAIRLDVEAGTATLAGVGNVDVFLHGFGELRLQVRRGVLGGSAPPPVVSQGPLPGRFLAVLYSDGISGRASWDGEPASCARETATETARRLLHERARDNDDATVLVVQRKD